MAYVRLRNSSSTLGYFACGPGCSCGPCRETAALGERYIEEEPDESPPPAKPPPMPPSSPASRDVGGWSSFGEACTPAPGIPNTDCSAYAANAWWLPSAYVNNAICACRTT